MSYQALYRVWRPQTFDDMVGQIAIKETLKNAVNNQQISHAYLFTGPRGTGKTSAAKILAKAVNCQHLVNGNPCNECEMCQLINEGQLSDVIEIDAASNNGVDEIRNLRDNVRYAANQGKYKVYIIDEVHMLTTGAFNALLKTLEEPPEQVIFILATTEPHKIPATILSRVQRFDFQRISEEDLISRMEYILKHDEIPYEEEALSIIARAANGGMRDSLSLLDQAISFNSGRVNLHGALEVSGSLSQLDLVEYIKAVYHKQSEPALEICRTQLQKGKQTSRFIEELIILCRDLLLSHHLRVNRTLLTSEELESIQSQVSADFYYDIIDQLNETQSKIRFTNQPDLYLEVMTIQLTQRKKRITQEKVAEDTTSSEKIDTLSQQFKALQNEMEQLKTQVASLDYSKETNCPKNIVPVESNETESLTPRQRPDHLKSQYQQELNSIYRVLNEATNEYREILERQWESIIAELPPPLRVKFVNTEPLASGNGRILISFVNELYCGEMQKQVSIQSMVSQAIETTIGVPMTPVFILAREWFAVRKNYTMLRKENNNQPIDLPEEKNVSDQAENDKKEPESQVEIKDGRQTDAETVEEIVEETVLPDFVNKTIDLFGKDNVNIYYDK